jgi:hypothetical protein
MYCSQHKKSVAGISDMKQLAEMIGDLHYESLAELLFRLNEKLLNDGGMDCMAGRTELGITLFTAADKVMEARIFISKAWGISKPFMESKETS